MFLSKPVIVGLTQPTESLRLARLRAPELAEAARPGQFLMVRCGEGWDPLLRRSFSVCQAYSPGANRGPAGLEPGEVSILFSPWGKSGRWLAQRQPGETLDIIGPLGNGFTISPDSRRNLLIAGGWGIAPMIALAEEGAAKGLSVAFLAGFQQSSQVLPSSLLPPGVEYSVATEDGSQGTKGSVMDIVPKFLDWADEVFISGPRGMLEAVYKLGQPAGKAMYGLFEEPMGCGMGVCLSCVLETRRGLLRCCSDGPVFALEEVFES